jgi:hypothetical protein
VRGFSLETSVLERLSGELCDTVTGRAESQAMLEATERAGLFLVSLDEVRVFAEEGPPMGACSAGWSPPSGQNRPQPEASRSAAWPGSCRHSTANAPCRAPGAALPRRCRA